MCVNRFWKNKLICKVKRNISRFYSFSKKSINKGKIKFYVQDEVMFEINKSTKRILMKQRERLNIKLEDKLHEWIKVSWFLGMNWKANLFKIQDKTWYSFKKSLIKLEDIENNSDFLTVVFVDNLSSHFTLDVLNECLKRKIMLIKFPAYSSELNPIEKLWKIWKNEVKMKFTHIDELWKHIQNYISNNSFSWLVDNFYRNYIWPSLQ